MESSKMIHSWFTTTGRDYWKGKALEAYTGAGKYSGRMSAKEGYKTFRFKLTKNSFGALLEKLKKISDDPENIEIVRLEGSPARGSGNLLLGNPIKAPAINSEISSLTEGDLEKKVDAVRKALDEKGKKLALFNEVELKDGQPVEKDPDLKKALTELTDYLREQFGSFVTEAGYENPDVLLITTSHCGYDRDEMTYGTLGEETRAYYDDGDNIVIVQTSVDADDLA